MKPYDSQSGSDRRMAYGYDSQSRDGSRTTDSGFGNEHNHDTDMRREITGMNHGSEHYAQVNKPGHASRGPPTDVLTVESAHM